jgi:hypothetical protein
MEAICSSETSVDTQRTTKRYIPEDGTLQKETTSYIHVPMCLIWYSFVSLNGKSCAWRCSLVLIWYFQKGEFDGAHLILTKLHITFFSVTRQKMLRWSHAPSCYCILLMQPSRFILLRIKPLALNYIKLCSSPFIRKSKCRSPCPKPLLHITLSSWFPRCLYQD